VSKLRAAIATGVALRISGDVRTGRRLQAAGMLVEHVFNLLRTWDAR
jgi:hypothetical protein